MWNLHQTNVGSDLRGNFKEKDKCVINICCQNRSRDLTIVTEEKERIVLCGVITVEFY
jgi:hypothetical protein